MDSLLTVLWFVVTFLLLFSGIYFTFKLNFVQFNLVEILKSFKDKTQDGEISSFEAFTMSLAGKIGVGSIAGVALAIYLGGIGTIFWMWICAFIVSSNAFCESVLGMVYRTKTSNGYNGGPYYYIDKGIGKKKLANFYALLIMCAYLIGFLTIQSNTITKVINTNVNINPIIIGIIISLITGFVIIKGIKSIAAVSSILVPIMGIIYISMCITIVLMNFNQVLLIITQIINNAFNFKSGITGFVTVFIIGMQRGIFSNEAGLGTGSIAAATATSSHSVKQGYIQTLGVYVTTLVICTLTAFVIILADATSLNLTDINGIELSEYAFSYYLGSLGSLLLTITIILFAFSTIITGYYYGESSFAYITKTKKYNIYIKISTLVLLVFGSFLSSTLLWKIVDSFVLCLALINVYALYKLRNVVLYELNDYKKNRQ